MCLLMLRRKYTETSPDGELSITHYMPNIFKRLMVLKLNSVLDSNKSRLSPLSTLLWESQNTLL